MGVSSEQTTVKSRTAPSNFSGSSGEQFHLRKAGGGPMTVNIRTDTQVTEDGDLVVDDNSSTFGTGNLAKGGLYDTKWCCSRLLLIGENVTCGALFGEPSCYHVYQNPDFFRQRMSLYIWMLQKERRMLQNILPFVSVFVYANSRPASIMMEEWCIMIVISQNTVPYNAFQRFIPIWKWSRRRIPAKLRKRDSFLIDLSMWHVITYVPFSACFSISFFHTRACFIT